jgi:1-acyl-sn-glycerol-3-phosphate acyltransferase
MVGTIIRGITFNIAFFLVNAILLTTCLPVLLGPDRWVVRYTEFWSASVMVVLRWIAGVTYEIRGLEHIPTHPCVIACKHQSAWETIIFHQILDHPALVMKKELMWIPVYGWYTWRLEMVAIDRKAGGSALRQLCKYVKQRINQGRHVVIFPEGTRTAPESADINYQPGIAALYGMGLSVVPAATNSGVYWGRRQWRKRPGKIVLEFLPVIEPGLSREAFMTRLQADIENRSRELVQCEKDALRPSVA